MTEKPDLPDEPETQSGPRDDPIWAKYSELVRLREADVAAHTKELANIPELPQIVGKPKLDGSLLPHYQQWKERMHSAGGLLDYLREKGNPDLAAAFSKLFWPDFVEVEGCIFLAERYTAIDPLPWTQQFKEWAREKPGNVEFTANYFTVPALFANSGPEKVDAKDDSGEPYWDGRPTIPQELFVYLAQVLLMCWKHALAETFPDKEFEFYYFYDETSFPPTISFYQKKHER